jgi:hypothetical protein
MRSIVVGILVALYWGSPSIAATIAPVPVAAHSAAVVHTLADEVKGLSWIEAMSWGPLFRTVNEKFIARLEKTSKPKLRYMLQYSAFMAQNAMFAKMRAKWKKLADECKRILAAAH